MKTEEEIYNVHKATFDELFKSYEYLLPYDKYRYIVISEIKKAKESSEENLIDFVTKSVRTNLSNIVKKQIKNPQTAFELINNYINYKFINVKNCNDALNYLQKLHIFLSTYNYEITIDLLIKLINKNLIFSSMLSIIGNQYYFDITKRSIEYVFDNITTIRAVEAYCIIMNIETFEQKNINFGLYEEVYKNPDPDFKKCLETIEKIPRLSLQEENNLSKQCSDEIVRNQLFNNNIILILYIINEYMGSGFDFKTLYEQCTNFLGNAIKTFDYTKGYRFSSYIFFTVKAKTISYIFDMVNSNIIPITIKDEFLKFLKARIKLYQVLNREPTNDEIAAKMQIKLDEVVYLNNLLSKVTKNKKHTKNNEELPGKTNKEIKKDKEYKEKAKNTTEEKTQTLNPNTNDKKTLTIDDYIKLLTLLKTQTFSQMIGTLSIKDAIIISLKLGFVDGKCYSTEAIAKFLETTESEVREITSKVMLFYKDNINSFIDNAINTISDKNIQSRNLTKNN